MYIINTHEAKTHFSKLIEAALAGEAPIIGRAGKPLVKLIAYHPPVPARKKGTFKDKIWMSDDFFTEDSEITRLFYGDDA